MKKYYFLSFLLVSVGLLGLSFEVLAKKDNKREGVPEAGIQISPTKFVWSLKSGEKKESIINVKNYSKIPQKIVVEAEDFYVADNGSEPVFFVPGPKHPRIAYDILEWMTLPEDFVLQPGESRNVKFVINVPKNQPTNGYYGSIFFKAVTDEVKSGSNDKVIGINYRIGSLIIMSVQGSAPFKIDGELRDFYPRKKVFWNSPAEVITKIINTGNIHYPMFGKIEVNRFGKKFHVVELKPQLLYPEKIKEYKEDVPFGFWDFGMYTAKLSMWSGNKKVNIEKEVSFWIIPWKGLAIIFGGFVFSLIVRNFIKKYVHIGRK